MIRGIGSDHERGRPEDAPIVKVADRTEIVGELTVYLREAPPEYVRERQQAVLDTIERLEAAAVLDGPTVVSWPKHVRVPTDRTDTHAGDAYREFADAVGEAALEPFFDRKPVPGRGEDVLVLPTICIALRTDDGLAGLYPHWNDGTHHSIEDCRRALSVGDAIANVSATHP